MSGKWHLGLAEDVVLKIMDLTSGLVFLRDVWIFLVISFTGE